MDSVKRRMLPPKNAIASGQTRLKKCRTNAASVYLSLVHKSSNT